MWIYKQATGELFDPEGELVGVGYSGAPGHVNDTAAEEIPAVGPCPRGLYRFSRSFEDGHLGKIVMALSPVAPFNAFHRFLLRIHGDNAKGNRSASEGCIVLGKALRMMMDASTDRLLQVV